MDEEKGFVDDHVQTVGPDGQDREGQAGGDDNDVWNAHDAASKRRVAVCSFACLFACLPCSLACLASLPCLLAYLPAYMFCMNLHSMGIGNIGWDTSRLYLPSVHAALAGTLTATLHLASATASSSHFRTAGSCDVRCGPRV